MRIVNFDLPKVSKITINCELLKVSKMTSLKIYLLTVMEKLKNYIWTASKPHSKESFGYPNSGGTDVINSYSGDFDKSL